MIRFLKNILKIVGDFFAPMSVSFSRKGVLVNVVRKGRECLAVATDGNIIPFSIQMPQKVLKHLIGQTVEYRVEMVFTANVYAGFFGSAYFLTQTERGRIRILTGILAGREFCTAVSVKTL